MSAAEIATVQPGNGAGDLLNIIASAASNPAVDVVKLQALLDMQERVLARQAEAEYNAALVRVTTGMPRVSKNGHVELGDKKGGYDWAKWEDMDTVIRPLMEREGFTLSWTTRHREGGGAVIVGMMLHVGGHSRSVEIALPLDIGPGRNNLQAMGSTLSYGKRYTAEMLLNIVREGADDDGKAGGTVYLTPEHVDAVLALLKEQNWKEADFIAFLQRRGGEARGVDEIEEKDFIRVMNALRARQAEIAKRAKSGGEPE